MSAYEEHTSLHIVPLYHATMSFRTTFCVLFVGTSSIVTKKPLLDYHRLVSYIVQFTCDCVDLKQRDEFLWSRRLKKCGKISIQDSNASSLNRFKTNLAQKIYCRMSFSRYILILAV